MGQAVEGKNVLIKIKKAGEYVPYACATSIDYTRDSETIETSTVDSAGEAEFEYAMRSGGATINGVTHIVPSETGFTVFELLEYMNNRTTAELEISFEDSLGNLRTLTGSALVVHVGISAGAEGFSEDDVELKGTGVAVIDTEYIDPVINVNEVFPLEFTSVSGGETSVVFTELVGKDLADILLAQRDGISKDIIDVGTPTDKQVKFISASGTFSLPYELGEGEWFYTLYK
jgi:hypothetical protein